MNLKRIMSAVLSGVILCSMTLSPLEQKDKLLPEALSGFNLNIEPITASAAQAIRRPVSNEQPMWIVHLDSWNYPDPA